MSKTTGSREARRLRAWELKQQGWLQVDIAHALGVTEGAVSQWIRRAREGGAEGLRDGQRSGRPRRISREELAAKLPVILLKGAESYGFRGDVWTLARVARVIEKELGVRYHKDHCCRLLSEIGWSCQKPKRRALQRNEEAIAEWRAKKWPSLKNARNGRARPSSS